MELKADSSQNQSHRVYPPFHADTKEIFDYPKNKLTALDMIGMHENIPGNPNKPSKSAWGRVRKIIQNFMPKCIPLIAISLIKFKMIFYLFIGKKDHQYEKRVAEKRVQEKGIWAM